MHLKRGLRKPKLKAILVVKVVVFMAKDQRIKFAKELHNGIQGPLCQFQVVHKEQDWSNGDKVKEVTKVQDKLKEVEHHAKLVESPIRGNAV